MNQSSNPALSDKAFQRFDEVGSEGTMSVQGTLVKAGYAFLVLLAGAVAGWAALPLFGTVIPLWVLWVGIGLTFAVGMLTVFKANPVTVTLYAGLEGAYLGIVSRAFETAYDGIVLQAILLTLAMTLGMFFLYATGAVKVTQRLRSVIIIATVGVLMYLVAEFFIALFVPSFLSVLMSGPTAIIIGCIIVLIASLNLLLDFDTISKGVANKLSKKAEWYAAFGLMVTLVWLYVSILRVLAASRR